MTRPEEERGEVVPEPRPQSPHDRAEMLVAQWVNGVPIRVSVDATGTVRLIAPQDVQQRMAADITALLNDTISREHNTP